MGMTKRNIDDSIKTSYKIDSLSWFEEVVFYRLLLTADDYGCLDGRLIVLRNLLFPTKDLETKDIEAAISKMVAVGLLRRYEVDGMPYLYFPDWEEHQRRGRKKRQLPPPPGEEAEGDQEESVLTEAPAETPTTKEAEEAPQEEKPNQEEAEKEPEEPEKKPEEPKKEALTASIYRSVIAHLNAVTGQNYRAGSRATQAHINARLKEGFTEQDFYTVINKKAAEWMRTDMAKYLRPETLFGSKFESYLNQAVVRTKPKDSREEAAERNLEWLRRYHPEEYEKRIGGGTVCDAVGF